MAASTKSAAKARRADIRSALDRVEKLCRRRGIRLTKLRRNVLELMLRGEQPIRAYDLLGKLDGSAGAKAPATIYRALNFLIEQKYVHKIESLNAFVVCLDVDHPHDSQFMICAQCGDAVEIRDAAVTRALRRHVENQGFRTSEQIIEVRGLCARCQAKPAANSLADA
ncbi:MAG TPA: transcriptional repressor [Stellaceae bacterium]|nr:transcriptional repressor [Stellaceae bacterium]